MLDVALFLPMFRELGRDTLINGRTGRRRRSGATAADAHAFARQLSKELIEVGFREVTVKELDLKPVPAVCVLARK
jgi:hypothetical protein